MRYVVGTQNERVYISCIKIDKGGIHFAYSTEHCTEIFEMVRLANWLNARHMVASVNEAIIMLLYEASKVAQDIWINVGD